jgi:hypothetical protein
MNKIYIKITVYKNLDTLIKLIKERLDEDNVPQKIRTFEALKHLLKMTLNLNVRQISVVKNEGTKDYTAFCRVEKSSPFIYIIDPYVVKKVHFGVREESTEDIIKQYMYRSKSKV